MAPHSWGQPWPPASGPAGRETPAEAPVAPQGSLCFLLLGRKHKEGGGEQASREKKNGEETSQQDKEEQAGVESQQHYT